MTSPAMMEKKIERQLEFILRLGQQLFNCGADSRRVLEILESWARHFELNDFAHTLTFRGLLISFKKGRRWSGAIAINPFRVDMTALERLSKLHHRAHKENWDLDEAEAALDEATEVLHNFPRWLSFFLSAVGCAMFALLFEGDFPSAGMAWAGALTGIWLQRRMAEYGLNLYLSVWISALAAVLVPAIFCSFGISDTPDKAILASVLFLIPGVPMINAAEDLIEGYASMSAGRFLHASAVVFTVGLGMAFAIRLTGALI